MQIETYTKDMLVIRMQSLPADCFCCGGDATGLNYGVPVYEDLILPNDWDGEWGGAAACNRCYDLQQEITEPVSLAEWAKRLNNESK